MLPLCLDIKLRKATTCTPPEKTTSTQALYSEHHIKVVKTRELKLSVAHTSLVATLFFRLLKNSDPDLSNKLKLLGIEI